MTPFSRRIEARFRLLLRLLEDKPFDHQGQQTGPDQPLHQSLLARREAVQVGVAVQLVEQQFDLPAQPVALHHLDRGELLAR